MRLTNDLRDRIERSVLKHVFDGREEELRKKRVKNGVAIYDAVIAPHLKALKSLPVDWVSADTDNDFSVKTDHQQYLGNLPLDIPRLQPAGIVVLVKDNPLTVECMQLLAEKEALQKERRARGGEVYAILKGVTTMDKLLELWPELVTILPADLTSKSLLPMSIDVEKLNQELGLEPAPIRAN